jgi:hypothetical protein
MKKNVRRLALSVETLHRLDPRDAKSGVVGGRTLTQAPCSNFSCPLTACTCVSICNFCAPPQ